jgi:hypothetical protein
MQNYTQWGFSNRKHLLLLDIDLVTAVFPDGDCDRYRNSVLFVGWKSEINQQIPFFESQSSKADCGRYHTSMLFVEWKSALLRNVPAP